MTETKNVYPQTTQEVAIFLELYRKLHGVSTDDYKYIAGVIDGYRLSEEKAAQQAEREIST